MRSPAGPHWALATGVATGTPPFYGGNRIRGVQGSAHQPLGRGRAGPRTRLEHLLLPSCSFYPPQREHTWGARTSQARLRGSRCCGVVFVGRVWLARLRRFPQTAFPQSQASPSGSAGYTAAVRAGVGSRGDACGVRGPTEAAGSDGAGAGGAPCAGPVETGQAGAAQAPRAQESRGHRGRAWSRSRLCRRFRHHSRSGEGGCAREGAGKPGADVSRLQLQSFGFNYSRSCVRVRQSKPAQAGEDFADLSRGPTGTGWARRLAHTRAALSPRHWL